MICDDMGALELLLYGIHMAALRILEVSPMKVKVNLDYFSFV